MRWCACRLADSLESADKAIQSEEDTTKPDDRTLHKNILLLVDLNFVFQNKKQRKMVRETVLKMKDPKQILEEMFKIDLMGN